MLTKKKLLNITKRNTKKSKWMTSASLIQKTNCTKSGLKQTQRGI